MVDITARQLNQLGITPTADPESGFGGFAAAGVGNMKNDYAAFQFRLTDAQGSTSGAATISVDIMPVADAPVITVAAVVPLHTHTEDFEGYGTVLSTGWSTTSHVNGWVAVGANRIEIRNEVNYLGTLALNQMRRGDKRVVLDTTVSAR